jgi:hypothetical protein
VIREVGPDGTREIPILQEVPDYFEFVPREPRFFRDWEAWSAGTERVFAHWALDVRDYIYNGEREVGFIPRPFRVPQEKLRAPEGVSVRLLMDQIEAIDRKVGLPFGWFFLMTHGNYVDFDVGPAIAKGLRETDVSACRIATRLCCCAGVNAFTDSEVRYGRYCKKPLARRRIPARPGARYAFGGSAHGSAGPTGAASH